MHNYMESFERCYPGERCKIRWSHKDQAYWVYIDGNKGDRPLTEDELREAARMLNAGK